MTGGTPSHPAWRTTRRLRGTGRGRRICFLPVENRDTLAEAPDLEGIAHRHAGSGGDQHVTQRQRLRDGEWRPRDQANDMLRRTARHRSSEASEACPTSSIGRTRKGGISRKGQNRTLRPCRRARRRIVRGGPSNVSSTLSSDGGCTHACSDRLDGGQALSNRRSPAPPSPSPPPPPAPHRRPRYAPRCLASAIPSRSRSRINARSNSALTQP